MEKEINIAAILRDKPKGTKLWSPIVGECTYKEYDYVKERLEVDFLNKNNESCFWDFSKEGKTYSAPPTAQVCLFPSKSMQDWSKFAWKKGDIIASMTSISIFDGFINDEYTKFNALYPLCLIPQGKQEKVICSTNDFTKVDSEKDIEEYIGTAQYRYKCKIDRVSLEIEKPQFKDGDILVMDKVPSKYYAKCILILRGDYNSNEETAKVYAFYNVSASFVNVRLSETKIDDTNIRLATDSEKQQLFAALEKENKAWDSEKKAIVDLPKKCEFKLMDWCLMRRGNIDAWHLCQYSDTCDDGFYTVGGNFFKQCIPYNEETKHLLGTTDE